MTRRRDIAEFVRILRGVDPKWMRERFTNGACYELSRLLKAAWPEGEQWVARWDGGGHWRCHVYTRYGEEFFDIYGPHRRATILKHVRTKRGLFRPMTNDDHWRAGQMNPRRLAETENKEMICARDKA